MPITIDGTFKRVGKKPRRKRASKLAGDTPPAGSFGANIWEWLHPGEVQTENVSVTGTNNPNVTETNILLRFQDQINAAVTDLDNASAQLNLSASNLSSIQDDVYASGDDSAISQYQDAVNRVNSTQSARDSALAAAQQARDFISATAPSVGLSGLGLLPAIPWAFVAAIVAGTAAIYAAANFANTFFNQWQIRRWNDANIAQQQAGGEPLQGQPLLADTSLGITSGFAGIGSIFSGMGDLTKWIVLGIGAYFVIKMLPADKE